VLLAAPETVADWLPIFFAIAMDLLASGLISMAFAPMRAEKPSEAPTGPMLLDDDREPAWLSGAASGVVRFPRVPKGAKKSPHPFWKADGRALRHLDKRAVNEN